MTTRPNRPLVAAKESFVKLASVDVRAIMVTLALVALVVFADVDGVLVAGYLIGLTENSPLDRPS